MRNLRRHPDFPAPDVAIEAGAERDGSVLRLRYVLTGAVSRVDLPAAQFPIRADELWRHTCFEAFIGLPDGGYYELNFAPSMAWAAYWFDAYREGMRNAPVDVSEVLFRRNDDVFELTACVGLPESHPWRVGLTAVIEDAQGARSYWALRHPPGKPDFHNADCFVLELPGSRGA